MQFYRIKGHLEARPQPRGRRRRARHFNSKRKKANVRLILRVCTSAPFAPTTRLIQVFGKRLPTFSSLHSKFCHKVKVVLCVHSSSRRCGFGLFKLCGLFDTPAQTQTRSRSRVRMQPPHLRVFVVQNTRGGTIHHVPRNVNLYVQWSVCMSSSLYSHPQKSLGLNELL